MGGHVVQGHVDSTGTLISLIPLSRDLDHTDWRMTIEVPSSMVPHIVPQGSITIDGISLTVAAIEGRRIEIAVIPHTYKATNLRCLMSGSIVNLESDVLSRYAAKQAQANSIAPPAPQPTPTPVAFAEISAVSEDPPALDTATLTQANDGWLTQAYLMENGY